MFCLGCCWNTRLRSLKYRRLGGQAIGSDAYAVLENTDVDQILNEREQAGKPPHEYDIDGYRYRGEELDGMKHGCGILTFPNGDSYEGEWYNDTLEGRGLLKFADGASYNGFFRNGMAHGSGVYTAAGPSAPRFEGEYHCGVRCGDGALHCANGDVVRGFYQLGAPQGEVDVTFANGDQYQGALQDGAMHGQGKFVPADTVDEFLECQWVQGLPHGRGVRRTGGVLYDVEYDTGVCISMERHPTASSGSLG